MKILIIDDNIDLLELLSNELSSNGYDVNASSSGRAALLEIEKEARPDLILLDVKMPGMNGQQFLDLLELQHPDILSEVPIVFNTAGDPPSDNRVSASIDKMADFREFLGRIRPLMGLRPRPPCAMIQACS